MKTSLILKYLVTLITFVDSHLVHNDKNNLNHHEQNHSTSQHSEQQYFYRDPFHVVFHLKLPR